MPYEGLCKYWQTIASELEASKDRVRDLIAGAHWPSDGSYKEMLLRGVLRRHLPQDLTVCTGFIYKNAEVSKQMDILVISNSGYTLFKEGEFVIVSPHTVRAIVEVKTSLRRSDFDTCLQKLAKDARLAEQELVQDRGEIWCGLYVYEGDVSHAEDLLIALSNADTNEGHPIICVAYGANLFTKFWSTGGSGPMWASHQCDGLAAGCFVMDMIAALTTNPGNSDFPILNAPALNGRIVPNLQIKRGESRVESIPRS